MSDDAAARSAAIASARAAVDAPSSAGAGAAALKLDEQASLLGAHSWVERRLFEILGAWVGDEAAPGARSMFDEHSWHHAWHAQLFWDRLPVLDRIDRESLVTAPGKASEWLLDQVASSKGTALRLALLVRLVLPRMIRGYTLHLERTAPVADAPTIRALRLVLRDEIESWEQTTALAERCADAERYADAETPTALAEVASLEAQMADPLVGLVPWPGSDPSG